MYKQLRRSYGFSGLSTLVRLFVLLNLIPAIRIVFTMLLIALGLAG